MRSKGSRGNVLVAAILATCVFPAASLAYCPMGAEPDGWWCDFFDDLVVLGDRWRTDDTWEVDVVERFVDPTFVTTRGDTSESILYWAQPGGIVNFRDYEVSASLSGDGEKVGILFYYQDDSNHYRLVFDNRKYQGDTLVWGSGLDDPFVHSVYLIRRVDSMDELLAIAPWPGTDFPTKPYNSETLRVSVVTGANDEKAIAAQYLNKNIGGGTWVDLFDEVKMDSDANLNFGWVGVYASQLLSEEGNYRMHSIDVRHIDRIHQIAPATGSLAANVSDPYLLDYRDSDGDGEVTVELEYESYPRLGVDPPETRYWFLDSEDEAFAATSPSEPALVTIPVGTGPSSGEHAVHLFVDPERTVLEGSKELWISSASAFTIAVLPDLHTRQSTNVYSIPDDINLGMRDYQVRAIMEEIDKRETEDNIKAAVQVGDMAMRGTYVELADAGWYFDNCLPGDMPIIAAVGNHDYMGCQLSAKPMDDRGTLFPDYFVFDVVTQSQRIKDGYGVETPEELDNMFFLLGDEYLGNTASGKWMVLSLQTEPMTRDLFWAEKVLKTYPDYNVILVTHQFLNEYDAYNPDNDRETAEESIADETMRWAGLTPPICLPPLAPPILPWPWNHLYLNWQEDAFTGARAPLDAWEFLRRYDQIKIVLDGHTSDHGGLLTKRIPRPCGEDLLAIMTDVSYNHSMQGAGGQFRLLEIDPTQSAVRGRLVYARPMEHIGGDYSSFNLWQQAINTVHSDAYFVQEMDLSNDRVDDLLLFEDFNYPPPGAEDGLPPSWGWVNDAGTVTEPNWHVVTTNTTASMDHPNAVKALMTWEQRESVIGLTMAKYGRVRETRNVGNCTPANNLHKGTFLVYDDNVAKADWEDYIFEIDIAARDNDGIGVMFYYTDSNNYYRFSMLAEMGCGQPFSYSLERVVNGTSTLLDWAVEDKFYEPNTVYKVVVDLSESGRIRVEVFDDLDNKFIDDIDAYDSSHTHGSVALYSWFMSSAIFDNVLVTKGANTYADTDETAPVPDIEPLPIIEGECSATVTTIPTATDSCSGVIDGTTTDPFVYTEQGTYTVTWTYDDGHENVATQEQTVIVDDVTAPVPDVETLPIVRGQCSASITSTPTATDSCSGTIVGTTTDPLEYFEQGTYTVTWTFDDGNENTTTQEQTVIVEDTMPPVIESLTASPDTLWPPNHKMVPVRVTVQVSDNCDAEPACLLVDVTSNEAQSSGEGGDRSPDWLITSAMTLDLRAERFGGSFGREYTAGMGCTDYAGNSSTAQVAIGVPHDARR